MGDGPVLHEEDNGIISIDIIIPRRFGSDQREETHRPNRVHPPEGYHDRRTWYNIGRYYTVPVRFQPTGGRILTEPRASPGRIAGPEDMLILYHRQGGGKRWFTETGIYLQTFMYDLQNRLQLPCIDLAGSRCSPGSAKSAAGAEYLAAEPADKA